MNGAARSGELDADMTLKDMERELILRKLEHTRGNRTQAAVELGISVRTLRNKLHLYADQGVAIPG
jgi:DNA-binding protein Fis